MYQKQTTYALLFGNRRINCDLNKIIHNDPLTMVNEKHSWSLYCENVIEKNM